MRNEILYYLLKLMKEEEKDLNYLIKHHESKLQELHERKLQVISKTKECRDMLNEK